MITLTINGREITAPKGQLVIEAAERHGVFIPRFCYHPRMNPVGMCRMCIVDMDTGRGPTLQPACMIEVAPDMKVDTESAGDEEGAGRRARVPVDQPSTRLPGVRQGRRVPAAGQRVRVRAG